MLRGATQDLMFALQGAGAAQANASSESKSGISAGSFKFLQDWLQRASGIKLDGSKVYLVESRLAPLLADGKFHTLDDLCRGLSLGVPGLPQKVVEAMTTHETFFFRDSAVFEALKHRVIPEMLEDPHRRGRLRIWSAAASSGQEAYSLAILLQELGMGAQTVSILATDLSEKVLARAKLGRYNQFEVSRGMSAETISRYFDKNGTDWQVRESLRSMVRFEQFDLRDSMRSMGKFDLVLCRNVLIYFDASVRDSILVNMREVLDTKGYLLLGTAEAPGASWSAKRFGEVSVYQQRG